MCASRLEVAADTMELFPVGKTKRIYANIWINLKMSRRNSVSVSDGSQCDSDLETLKSAIAAKPTLYWPTGSMVSCLSHTDS